MNMHHTGTLRNASNAGRMMPCCSLHGKETPTEGGDVATMVNHSERLAEIMQKVAEGSYVVDLDRLAQAIVIQEIL